MCFDPQKPEDDGPSIKRLKFMDGAHEIIFPSIKQAVFMDGELSAP